MTSQTTQTYRIAIRQGARWTFDVVCIETGAIVAKHNTKRGAELRIKLIRQGVQF